RIEHFRRSYRGHGRRLAPGDEHATIGQKGHSQAHPDLRHLAGGDEAAAFRIVDLGTRRGAPIGPSSNNQYTAVVQSDGRVAYPPNGHRRAGAEGVSSWLVNFRRCQDLRASTTAAAPGDEHLTTGERSCLMGRAVDRHAAKPHNSRLVIE